MLGKPASRTFPECVLRTPWHGTRDVQELLLKEALAKEELRQLHMAANAKRTELTEIQNVNVVINERARAIEEARELEAALRAKRQEIAKYDEEIAEYRTLKALLPD
ncbi:hypothetical protein RRG08_018948 [Elysia crispata]|uniref:Uncharacterized protein n=1 Tax=Elysia crispata TaxID=231223 RepID=A0AAE1DSE2_9GAST|nr:hypothetical protein RRG08_018948 [Elysia crispata]